MSWLVVISSLLLGYVSFFLVSNVGKILRRKRILKDVPGLKEDWILGHGRYFMNKSPAAILETLERFSNECGRIWKVFLLHETIVAVSDPKIVEAILTSTTLIKKSTEYSKVRNWLNDGLLLSSGKKWMSRRKVMTPAFHFNILEQFVEVFDRNSSILVDVIAQKKTKDPVDIYPLVTLTALDIICETAMSASIDAQRNADSEYVKAVKKITYVIHMRIFDIFLRNDITYPWTKTAKREKEALKILHNFTDSVIQRRRKDLLVERATVDESSAPTKPCNDDFGVKRKEKMALLDILLQSTIDGKPLTNAEIREEVDTFMFEGHDTTTSGIVFSLYCIAKHPEVQEKVLKEIHAVIGEDRSTPTTLQMLNNLPYLDMALKEAMRLYPSVPLIGRAIEEDIVIKNLTLPAGINLAVGLYFVHRDPDLFPNPEEYIPERFLDGDKVTPFSYLPFSAGPRNCIGQKFAMLEMKSVVSKVLRNFKISVDPSYKGPVLIAEIILKPENGVLLNFEPR